MKKAITTIITIMLLGMIVWLTWNQINKTETVPVTPEQALDQATQADTTNDIDSELNYIEIENSIDEDLKSIDTDLQSL